MRVLFHPKVGALFVDRFSPDARVIQHHSRSGPNWRAWFLGRWRIMVVRATPHWSLR